MYIVTEFFRPQECNKVSNSCMWLIIVNDHARCLRDYWSPLTTLHFGNYAACDDVSQSKPCWHLFELWSSARLTIVAQYWSASLNIFSTDLFSGSSTLPPDSCTRRGVLNTSAPLLRDLHWLQVPERIRFRLCVLTYRCLNGTAPSYLAESIRRPADIKGSRHLRSSATTTLIVPPTRRSTLGDRAFPVSAARAWNSLPSAVRATYLITFRRELKAYLYHLSFVDHWDDSARYTGFIIPVTL